MATISVTYNAEQWDLGYIYTTTGGGTVFSSNLVSSTAFDLFSDTAVVDDCIYFGLTNYSAICSDFTFNIGTAFNASSVTFVWEYYKRNDGWTTMEDLEDDTVGFTVLGSNRVKFPNQWSPHTATINGVATKHWYRCRITAISGITEGGRTITDTVKRSSGYFLTYGGTDADPLTFEDVYQYIKTNLPYISVSKRNDYSYNFTKIGLQIMSRLKTTNEVVELGMNVSSNTGISKNLLNYIESGVKKDDTTGYNGSTFIVYGVANTVCIDISGGDAKLYGSTLVGGAELTNTYGKYPGYFSPRGEMIDCKLALSIRLPTSGNTMNNVRVQGDLLIAGTLSGTFKNIFYLCTGYYFLYVYRSSILLEGFGYSFSRTAAYMMYCFAGSDRRAPVFELRNPSTPLTLVTDGIKPLRISRTGTLYDILGCKVYDSSAGTYTDYTTEAKSTSVDDVPLTGDVGDSIMFCLSKYGTGYGTALKWLITSQSNDYEYVWEYYHSGSWIEADNGVNNYLHDSTSNLTQDGSVWCITPYNISSVTFDGTTGRWLRARITKKGSSSPVATQIRQITCSMASDWVIKETYDFDLKVVEEDGTAISGAIVTLTDQNGNEVFSLTTSVDGTITTQQTTVNEIVFAPLVNSNYQEQTIYTTVSLKVTAIGYASYEIANLPLGGKIDWIVKMGAGPETKIYDSTLYDSTIY